MCQPPTTYPADTPRVKGLRRRVRAAMERPPADWQCPPRIDDRWWGEPLAVRKARAIELKLAHMPTDLWTGQLLAGSMTLEKPRIHAEWGFPTYITDAERELGRQCGYDTGCFGHIVPDYPHLLAVGLRGIRAEADAQRPAAATPAETAFLDSAVVALNAVIAFADRLADRCAEEACLAAKRGKYPRARELAAMADNVLFAPAGPARTFWQALQSVWLLHMVFHSTMDGNAMGRLDQYCWPLLEADLAAGRIDWPRAMELVSCFALKFNERARASDEQRPETRGEEALDAARLTRHATSSQLGRNRDRLDATNHWLQNIVVGGLRPDGSDGTNPLTFLLLEAYRRNEMTNPLLTVRLHAGTPPALLDATCEVLKCGGGMPALFNDEALVPAIERLGIPRADALDYTNDGCWETIVPGRTDFRFQRMSLMLPLEWALTGGRSRVVKGVEGIDTGDARRFATFDELWAAWCRQLDAMVAGTVRRVVQRLDERSVLAPVPLLSALIDGSIASRRDLTAGGAKYRTYGFLAEGAAHAIDSLVAVRTVIFEQHAATMAELCDALDADFAGCDSLRLRLEAAPKYGNDDDAADSLGRSVMAEFAAAVQRHAAAYEPLVKAACGAATFSWYIGIGEGLGASPDGRRAGEPVSSNLSPALGRDVQGLPGAILSYAHMPHANMPAGAPLDLRVARRLVERPAGTDRMAALLRTFIETGGSMLTLTVADTEELRAAQRDPDRHKSLRVRMGGWSAYFTMLSHQQQDHHIRRQEPRR